MQGIIGFRMPADSLEGKFKLGQERSEIRPEQHRAAPPVRADGPANSGFHRELLPATAESVALLPARLKHLGPRYGRY